MLTKLVAGAVLGLALPFAVWTADASANAAPCACCGVECRCDDCACDALGCACDVGGPCYCDPAPCCANCPL